MCLYNAFIYPCSLTLHQQYWLSIQTHDPSYKSHMLLILLIIDAKALCHWTSKFTCLEFSNDWILILRYNSFYINLTVTEEPLIQAALHIYQKSTLKSKSLNFTKGKDSEPCGLWYWTTDPLVKLNSCITKIATIISLKFWLSY